MSNPNPGVTMTPPPIAPVPPDVERPLWSVMIPTFNCAQYLRQSLESVLAQDPGPERMQIEVIDDCSTQDDPETVVREVGKGRVAFYRQSENMGATANFNTCIERSRGNLVHILHGDDWVESDFYLEIDKLVQQYNNAALFTSRFYYAEEDGCRTGISPRLKHYETSVSHDSADFSCGPVIHFVGSVIRRCFFEEQGGFIPNLVHAADWEMWVRATRKGGLIMTSKVLGNYRVFAGNDTGRLVRFGENLLDRQRCIQKLSSEYKDFDVAIAELATLMICQAQENKFMEIGDKESARRNREFWNKNATIKQKVERILRENVRSVFRFIME
jgi:glycosyltransferase involved in cell wall biosynthesis